MSNHPTVLLVEDHLLTLAGLRISLDRLGCCQILGEAQDGDIAVREAQRLRPDVVLMDVGLPGIDGIEATWRIKQILPRTRVIMFTSHTMPDDVTAALGAGADGYCSKSTSVEQIACAINSVMRGEAWLDPAIADAIVNLSDSDSGIKTDVSGLETNILLLIKEGLGTQEIANRLNVSAEKVTRVMQQIIHRFMAKKEAVPPQKPNDQRVSHDWLTAFVEGVEEGKTFADKYQIVKLLGSGGMGAVFKAKHLYMDSYVALKVLHPNFVENRLALRNFQGEAKAIANLHHKNIVAVYDFGLSPDSEPYLVMECVDGSDLAEVLLKEKQLSVSRIITLCLQVCAGLAEAHARGIVHCDLKPSNILIEDLDAEERVKLVDFGLAQIMPVEPAARLDTTSKLFVAGTPLYMSPEQCSAEQLTSTSDIYSLGCIMYEALTGVNVFESSNPMATFIKQCQFVPPPLSVTCPSGMFSEQLEDLISRMLAKEPAKRPQSMNQVMEQLTTVLEPAAHRLF
jgi:DNA-binding NarL/FixJ family response regulator